MTVFINFCVIWIFIGTNKYELTLIFKAYGILWSFSMITTMVKIYTHCKHLHNTKLFDE